MSNNRKVVITGETVLMRARKYSPPFVKLYCVPYEMRPLTALSGRAVALFMVLSTHIRLGNYAKITQQEIEDYLGVKKSDIYLSLKKLKDAGLVKRIGKGQYKLNPDFVWQGEEYDRMQAVKEWPSVGLKKGETPVQPTGFYKVDLPTEGVSQALEESKPRSRQVKRHISTPVYADNYNPTEADFEPWQPPDAYPDDPNYDPSWELNPIVVKVQPISSEDYDRLMQDQPVPPFEKQRIKRPLRLVVKEPPGRYGKE